MATGPDAHRDDVERARAEREQRLRDPTGWLTLVGLHWLQPGEQRFGGAATNEIVLRAEEGELPPVAGILSVADGRVVVSPIEGAGLTANGEVVARATELLDDEQETPTALAIGIPAPAAHPAREGSARAPRAGHRRACAAHLQRGCRTSTSIPPGASSDASMPAEPGATIPVPDVLGDVNEEPTPGVVELSVLGRVHRLAALESSAGRLWLVFGDETNGTETYGGGRFLVTGPVQPDRLVEVDFNLAYNPPCVFSPYATCPLPPDGNRLPIRIEAGERALPFSALPDVG